MVPKLRGKPSTTQVTGEGKQSEDKLSTQQELRKKTRNLKLF